MTDEPLHRQVARRSIAVLVTCALLVGLIGAALIAGGLRGLDWWSSPVTHNAAEVSGSGAGSKSGSGPSLPNVPLDSVPPAFVEALRTHRQAVESAPDTADRWGQLGMFLMAHHYHSAALECLDEASKRDPQRFSWQYCAAVILEGTDLESSAQFYRNALQKKPDYAAAHQRLGRVLLQLGQSDGAAKHFQTATQLTNGHPFPQTSLARVHIAEGKLEEGRELLEDVVRRANWYRDAQAELARVYFSLENDQKALEASRMARRLPPSPSELPDPVLREVEEKEVVARRDENDAGAFPDHSPDAEQRLRERVAQRPDLARPQIKLGEWLLGQGQLREAIMVLETLVERFPQQADAYYLLGLAFESDSRPARAKTCYRKAAQLDPASAEAHYALGRVLERGGELAEATEHYEQAVAAGPQFAPAHLALGVALDRQGLAQQAIPHVRNAVRLSPGDPSPQELLDQLLEKAQDPPALP